MENHGNINLPADPKNGEKPQKYPLGTQQETGGKPLKNRLPLYPKTDEKTPEISLTSTPGEHPTERRPRTSPRKPPHTHTVPQNPSERTPQRPHTGRKQKNRPTNTPTKTATTSPQNGDQPSTTKRRHSCWDNSIHRHKHKDAHTTERQQPNVQPCIKDGASPFIAR